MNKALKLIRVAVSVTMLAAITLLFATAEAAIALKLQWAARIQIVPLALSVSLSLIGFWAVVTLVFGRIYCSTVCPLGAFQDVAARLYRTGRRRRMRHAYHYSRPFTKTRVAVLACAVTAAVAGLPAVLTLLDPYSAYGRIAANIVRPAADLMLSREIVAGSAIGVAIAAITVVAVGWLAARSGRTFCNTLCPVGAGLGIFSRVSVFHFDIDTDLCTHCRRCEHACKSSCINMDDHTVDGSRCVTCFNCVAECPVGAIKYTVRRKRLSIPMMQRIDTAPQTSAPVDGVVKHHVADKTAGRRHFIAAGLLLAAAPAIDAADKASNRIKALETGAAPLTPLRSVIPPGARSRRIFMERCTGCGLCVSHCTGKVLTPATSQLGLRNALHPAMDFGEGCCLYNCNRCTQLCPTGALLPLTREEKHSYICGTARVETGNCIGCGQCVRRCPRAAVKLTETAGRRVAAVDSSQCIGCGACEYICPASPFKAIVVDGNMN